jgi:hypothetical protein
MHKGIRSEVKRVEFYQFPKYHMKIFLGDFNAKLGEKVFSN